MSNVETNLIIRGFDKTQDAFKSLDRNLGAVRKRNEEVSKSFENITAVSKKMAIGGGVAFGALALGIKGVTQEAMQAERVTQTFMAMTKSIGTDVPTAIDGLRKATRGLVDDTNLMQAGNKFMAMGLASNGEEMNKLAEIATKLGSAMGNDATSSMENFALMLANQSILRLDSFGISSGKVRERIEELIATTEGMTREQAFMQATMEEAEKSMAKLGDTALTNGEKWQAFQARISNIRNQLGDALLPVLLKVGEKITPIVDKILSWVQANPDLTAKILLLSTALAGLVTVVGLLGMALPGIIMGFGALATVVGIIFSPIGAIVALLAVIGASIYYLASNWQQHWDNIKWAVGLAGEFIGGVVEKIKTFFANLGTGLIEFAKSVYDASTPLQLLVGTIKGVILFLDILLHVMIGLFQLAMPYIEAGVAWVGEIFGKMRDAIAEKLSFVGTLLSAVGDFLRTLAGVWGTIWGGVVEAMTPIVEAIAGKFEQMRLALSSMVEGAKNILKTFGNFFIDIAEGIGNAWVKMVNAIVDALNKIQVTIPDWVPKYGGRSFGINLPQAKEVTIPRLAEGGIATKSILANIGEAGPEAIIPLDKLNRFGGIGPTITVRIDNYIGNDEFAETIGNRFIDVLKRNQIVQA